MLTRGEDPREENEEHPSPTIDGDAGPLGGGWPQCAERLLPNLGATLPEVVPRAHHELLQSRHARTGDVEGVEFGRQVRGGVHRVEGERDAAQLCARSRGDDARYAGVAQLDRRARARDETHGELLELCACSEIELGAEGGDVWCVQVLMSVCLFGVGISVLPSGSANVLRSSWRHRIPLPTRSSETPN